MVALTTFHSPFGALPPASTVVEVGAPGGIRPVPTRPAGPALATGVRVSSLRSQQTSRAQGGCAQEVPP